ncbi:MAG TPA: hypothetical protein VKQ09_09205, partial [Sphingomonas sp.]|nr:hypothetical protein [Sphingomonas sp.]
MTFGLLAFAWHRSQGNPASLVLGIGIAAVMAAMARERLVLRLLGDGARAPAWGADVDALALLFVPFALAQQTLAGLAALGLYAAGSFAMVQHRLVKQARTES